MAHEITHVNGQAQMFYVGETPWHSLGQKYDVPPANVVQALMLIGIYGQYTKEPLYTADGRTVESLGLDDKTHLIRNPRGEGIGVVGTDYTILQPSEAFPALQTYVDNNLASVETGMSLRNGAKLVVTLKVNNGRRDVLPGDPTDLYLMASVGYDGKASFVFGGTRIRVVCANTEMAARNAKDSSLLKFKHTAGIAASVEKAVQAIAYLIEQSRQVDDVLRALAKVEITDDKQIRQYVDKVTRPERVAKAKREADIAAMLTDDPEHKTVFADLISRPANISAMETPKADRNGDQILQLFHGAQRGYDLLRANNAHNSGLAAYYAVSEWRTHNQGRNDEARAENTLFGPGGQKALDVAQEMFL